MSVRVKDVIARLLQAYPLVLQESWDRNGLIVGNPEAEVERILVAVDPTLPVVEEAIEKRCQLIVTHHPLLLRGVHFLGEDTPKGKIVSTLIKNDIALYNCHTNADSAAEGVAQAFAELLNLQDIVPLAPQQLEDESGQKLGLGRVGVLPVPMAFKDLGKLVAKVLPACPAGILLGGDLQAEVSKVVVSPGSGDSFLTQAREVGADVYICADLRHHPASEHLEAGRPYLINVTHWASEWPWVPKCAALLETAFSTRAVKAWPSNLVTDSWVAHISQNQLN